MENTALSSWAGTSNITTLGTIATGVWNGTDVAVADGGTGLSTLTTAYGLLAAGTTATGNVQTLAAGAITQILVGGGTGALPAWGTNIPTAVTIGSAYVYRASGTDIPVLDGGTGASDVTNARLNLGLAIGSNVQAYNSNLTAIDQALTTASSPTFAGLTVGTTDVDTSIGVAGSRARFGYNAIPNMLVVQATAGKGINFNVNNATFGNGTAMTITSAGLVGIGATPATGYNLDVFSSTTNTNVALRLKNGTARGGAVVYLDRNYGAGNNYDNSGIFYQTNGTTNWYAGIPYNAGQLTTQYVIGSDENLSTANITILTTDQVGINDTTPTEGTLTVGGTLYVLTNTGVGSDPLCWDGSGGSLYGDCTSLQRYKTNVSDLDVGLDDILQLKPRSFSWKRHADGTLATSTYDILVPDVGLIAEEVEAVNPLLASYENGQLDGYKERGVVVALVNAVQEQQIQIVNLNNLVNNSSTTLSVGSGSNNNLATLTVTQSANFFGIITVIGEAGFTSRVTFSDHVYFDKDSAGTARLLAGATSTEVIFAKPYEAVPIINITAKANAMGRNYWVENETTTGFRISVDNFFDNDFEFNWQAVAIASSTVDEINNETSSPTVSSTSDPSEFLSELLNFSSTTPTSTDEDISSSTVESSTSDSQPVISSTIEDVATTTP